MIGLTFFTYGFTGFGGSSPLNTVTQLVAAIARHLCVGLVAGAGDVGRDYDVVKIQ